MKCLCLSLGARGEFVFCFVCFFPWVIFLPGMFSKMGICFGFFSFPVIFLALMGAEVEARHSPFSGSLPSIPVLPWEALFPLLSTINSSVGTSELCHCLCQPLCPCCSCGVTLTCSFPSWSTVIAQPCPFKPQPCKTLSFGLFKPHLRGLTPLWWCKLVPEQAVAGCNSPAFFPDFLRMTLAENPRWLPPVDYRDV